MRVQDLMSYPAITCHVNDPLNIPAQLMWDHACGAVIVVNDEGKLAGMITDRDICMGAYTQGRALDAILVNVAMGNPVFAVTADQSIADVETLMTDHLVHRIPVVDADRRPIGLISTSDLAIESIKPDPTNTKVPSKLAQTLAAVADRTRRHHA
jgi:CBS domain-containing protein